MVCHALYVLHKLGMTTEKKFCNNVDAHAVCMQILQPASLGSTIASLVTTL